jgi:hypothetical protein
MTRRILSDSRRKLLRVIFLIVFPAMAIFFLCSTIALIVTRPNAAITPAEIEATVQARVDGILSDRPAADAATPAAGGGGVTGIIAGIGNLITQGLALIGLGGVGEAISGLLLNLWGFVSGIGWVAQLACCCVLPIGLLIGARLLGEFIGD